MIKKLLLPLAFLMLCFGAKAQNLQLHFDPRSSIHGTDAFERDFFTATFEMYKQDKLGSTFMFMDVNFSEKNGNIGLAYLEIARDFKWEKSPVMAHIEFNGGIALGANTSGFSIPNAYLVGPSYVTKIHDVGIGTYLVYKYNAFEKGSNDVQWTVTWGVNVFNDKLTIKGFVDLWTENRNRGYGEGAKGKKMVLVTEPQFWYNVTKQFAVGSEVEISNNFIGNATYVNPTLAAKWEF